MKYNLGPLVYCMIHWYFYGHPNPLDKRYDTSTYISNSAIPTWTYFEPPFQLHKSCVGVRVVIDVSMFFNLWFCFGESTNHFEFYRWVRDFLNEENRGLDVLVNYLSFTQMLMQ